MRAEEGSEKPAMPAFRFLAARIVSPLVAFGVSVLNERLGGRPPCDPAAASVELR